MATINFEQAYAYTYIDEKGKDDDPEDRGGRTCDGITQDEYDAWCALHGSPSGDVWDANAATLKAIYHINYWAPWCDRLPNAIDYLFFDMAVNSGTHEASLILQRALSLNRRQIDGRIGVFTVHAANTYVNQQKLIEAICEEHDRVYSLIIDAHPTDRKFLHGWENRIVHERQNALTMLENFVVHT
jgi:lysozyme family protein